MLLVFDWDGTLIDSTARIVQCMQQAALDTGMPPLAAAAVRDIIGLGLPEAIAVLYPQHSSAVREEIRQHYVQHFIDAELAPSALFDGVLDTLLALRQQGHHLAVATGKSRRGLDRVLQNLGMESFFDNTRCADETLSKPDPKMLFELMQDFSVSPEDMHMIGDTTYDMEMAQRAGVPRIAVSYGAHTIERLLPYEPLACLDAMPELLHYLSDTAIGRNKITREQFNR